MLGLRLIFLLVIACWTFGLTAAETLSWNSKTGRVTADIRTGNLHAILKRVATSTGWTVYVEPGIKHPVSTKFKDLPPGEALPLLLGGLNFALVPATNTSPKLFVFATSRTRATELVSPAPDSLAAATNRIPNELVVRLKPGGDIKEVAAKLGAKVKGRIAGLDAYQLEFEDETAADAARTELAAHENVSAVDYNYSIERPDNALPRSGNSPPPPQLTLKPPPDNGRIVVGLIDTAIQPLGNNLDKFILNQVSIAGESQVDPSSPSHGTSMAETVLRSLQAATKGSTSVQILPVDVYGANPSTSTFDVANGIIQAVNGGAKVVNLSLGSEADSPFLHDVIKEVNKRNITIFAAAGNEPTTTPFYPAAYPEVTAVTAVERGRIADYASRGEFVSLGAPGTSVVHFNGQPYYIVGTSASSAFTAGVAAGYLETTKGDASKLQSFLNESFGLKSEGNP